MKLKIKNPLIFFDLETTGTDTKKDRIIEIYAKKIFPDGKTEELYELFNPLIPISEEATAIHGFTKEKLEDYPSFSKKAVEIYSFFKDCDLGGYNCIKFDIPFLMEELTRHKQPWHPLKANIIDPYMIIGKMESNKLVDVYKRYFGEDFDGAHGAKADIDATIRVFEHQMERYDLGTIEEITTLVRSDGSGNKFIDFAGVFYKKEDDYYFGIGKYKNNRVGNHMSYLNWIIDKSDMQQNVKMVANILKSYYESKNTNKISNDN